MQLSFVEYSVTILFNDIMQSRCEFKIFTDEPRIFITSIWLTPHAYVSDCADYLDSIASNKWDIVWFHLLVSWNLQHAAAALSARVWLWFDTEIEFDTCVWLTGGWRLVSACINKPNWNDIYRCFHILYWRFSVDRDKIESTWRSINVSRCTSSVSCTCCGDEAGKIVHRGSCAWSVDYLQFMESEQMQYITNGWWRRWQRRRVRRER